MTNDHLFALRSHMYLLECTLVTYAGMCSKKGSSKSELDRHQSIIQGTFEVMYLDFREALRGLSFKAKWADIPKVAEILSHTTKGDSVEDACHRFFNKCRYGVG